MIALYTLTTDQDEKMTNPRHNTAMHSPNCRIWTPDNYCSCGYENSPTQKKLEEVSTFIEILKDTIAQRDIEIDRLREALEEVVKKDERSMYESCHDCWNNTCALTKQCCDIPLSPIGRVAKKALSTGHTTPAISKTAGQTDIGEG